MDTFFTFLKKTLVATVFTMFALVATYVPQIWNDVKQVQAAYVLETTGWVGNVINATDAAANNVSAGANTATAGATVATAATTETLWFKEYVLDGIAWYAAKALLSQMMRSLTDWVNSGFKGSPSFLTDIKGFLLDVGDRAMGEFINDMVAGGSFVCSPFKLDINLALDIIYLGNKERPAECRLSGVLTNIDNFVKGSFIDSGGWESWFDVTTNAEQYTPYGSLLAAKTALGVKLTNDQDQEIDLLGFGAGFYSFKDCPEVEQENGTIKEECTVLTPGKVIQDKLDGVLGTGDDSLIAADEFDELLAALLNQFSQKAITGAKGLLGLSGSTGYTYDTYEAGSFTAQVESDVDAIQPDDSENIELMKESLATQVAYNTMATNYIPLLEGVEVDPSVDEFVRFQAEDAKEDAERVVDDTAVTLGILPGLIAEMEDEETTPERKSQIISEFFNLTRYTEREMKSSENAWDNILALPDRLITQPPDEGEGEACSEEERDADGNCPEGLIEGGETGGDGGDP